MLPVTDAQRSLPFEQAVPRRHGVSLVACCLVLFAASVYGIYVGNQFLTSSLGGGYEVLAFTATAAVVFLLLAAGMLIADRVGRQARIVIGEGAVTLHSRGVLCKDVVLPMTQITDVKTYPWQHPAAQLPRGAASITPLSMGPWLALSVTPLVVPARRSSWMWRWLFRWSDFSHVRTPLQRETYSMILFGTTRADQAVDAIRERLPS